MLHTLAKMKYMLMNVVANTIGGRVQKASMKAFFRRSTNVRTIPNKMAAQAAVRMGEKIHDTTIVITPL